MMKEFFRKKALGLAGVFSAFAVFSGLAYAGVLANSVFVDVGQNFYFLVSEEENVSAAALNVYFNGGAGYVMEYGGRDLAVIACYLSETDALSVQKKLKVSGVPTSLERAKGGTLCLKTRREKREESQIVGSFTVFRDCIRLLSEIVGMAESGATQQTLRSVLGDTKLVLSSLAAARSGATAELSLAAESGVERTEEILSGTIYAKDIACLQIFLCDSYLGATEKFSL